MSTAPEPDPTYPVTQLTPADLASMTPDQINDALHAGRLDALLGAPARPVAARLAAGGQLTRDDLAHLTPAEIDRALDAGQLSAVLTNTPTER